jgi:hypothetical protein
MQILSLLAVQILELIGTLFLLQWTAKPQYKLINFFEANKLSKERNWLLASVLGCGFLFLLVFVTSILADRLIGPKVGAFLFSADPTPNLRLIFFFLFMRLLVAIE